MAYRNAERLNSTLNQLLDLSKLVSGRLVCRFHEVALSQLVQVSFDRFKTEAAKRKDKVTVSGKIAELPVILGDAPRLEKVVRSLFENAQRFSPAGSKLALKIVSKDETVSLELSNPVDESVGATSMKAIFGIFGQQEGILDRTHEGVGGSLAIAREVVRQHGGALEARLEDGAFTIRLTLPVLRSEAALGKVLESRMFALRTEVGAISLMILETRAPSLKTVHEAVKNALFRASDSVYDLPKTSQVAVVMDDCKKADAPKLVRRLLDSLGKDSTKALAGARVGVASFPDDGTEPEGLLKHARSTLVPLKEL
ncbi:MAG: hypothetical protein HY075_12170 [Deltaproteobacteria bacterium]|nr:hypothetical protein [Deltaproteobacteria bacterium]